MIDFNDIISIKLLVYKAEEEEKSETKITKTNRKLRESLEMPKEENLKVDFML